MLGSAQTNTICAEFNGKISIPRFIGIYPYFEIFEAAFDDMGIFQIVPTSQDQVLSALLRRNKSPVAEVGDIEGS